MNKCERCGNDIVVVKNRMVGLSYDFKTHQDTKGKIITETTDINVNCKFCGRHLCPACTLYNNSITSEHREPYCEDCKEKAKEFFKEVNVITVEVSKEEFEEMEKIRIKLEQIKKGA